MIDAITVCIQASVSSSGVATCLKLMHDSKQNGKLEDAGGQINGYGAT